MNTEMTNAERIDTIKEFFKKIRDFDLSKKYPNLINKKINRFAFLFVLLVVSGAVYQSWGTWSYITYTCNDPAGCINPYYICRSKLANPDCFQFGCNGLTCTIETPQKLCDIGICSLQYLEYQQTIGQKPPYLVENGLSIIFSILAISAFLNIINFLVTKK